MKNSIIFMLCIVCINLYGVDAYKRKYPRINMLIVDKPIVTNNNQINYVKNDKKQEQEKQKIISNLENVLRIVHGSCSNISSDLADIKKMAGISTAVSVTATGLGVGATVVGVKKYSKDNEILNTKNKIKELNESHGLLNDIIAYHNLKITEQLDKEKKEIKKLGNWRTGLLAGNVAGNITSSLVSGNINNDSIKDKIEKCVNNLDILNNNINEAKMNGIDVNEAQEIYKACIDYKYAPINKIDEMKKGTIGASVTGSVLGGVGVITSAISNTDKVIEDQNKNKTLNMTSNVLAGSSALASGVSSVFSGMQIKTIKQVSNIADKCEGVLK